MTGKKILVGMLEDSVVLALRFVPTLEVFPLSALPLEAPMTL